MAFTETLPERFEAKFIPEPNTGCWLWFAAHYRDGYGAFGHPVTKKVVRAHRYAYEQLVGPIPEGLQIDHLCRTPACVNPEHMEPVTQQENMKRGRGASAVNARKTHCPRGHEYSASNTWVIKRGVKKGHRICRTCDLARRKRPRRAA